MVEGESVLQKARQRRAAALRRIGRLIKGRWYLSGLLGSGGMAAVFAATDLRGRHAALKVLHAELLSDPDARERFEREAWVARSVQHPCLVTVFDEGTTELGEPFLVMEQLEGSSLERQWKRAKNKLPATTVLRVAERTLDLLAACHRMGVIHRDLKPANLYITHVGDVKVIDFGIARVRDVVDLPTGVAVGTPSFMSPEQASGDWSQVDERTDLFAVGATMFTLLSGVRLHLDESGNASFKLASTTPAPSLASVAPDAPASLVALVDRALAWDKNARWPDADTMREQVEQELTSLDDGTSTLTSTMPRPNERSSLMASLARQASLPPALSRRPPADHGAEPARIPPPPSLPSELEPTDPQEARRKTSRFLVEAFQMLEQLLAGVAEEGFSSGAFRERLSAAHALLARATRAHSEPLRLGLFPFCVTWGETNVWEPEPPLDTVPHALYSAGVRFIRFVPGLSLDDLRRLVELLTDAVTSSTLLELQAAVGGTIPHVAFESVSIALSGDGSERGDAIEAAQTIASEWRRMLQKSLALKAVPEEPPPALLKREVAIARGDASRRLAASIVEEYLLQRGQPGEQASWEPLRKTARRAEGASWPSAFMLYSHVREALVARLENGDSTERASEILAGALRDEDLRAMLGGAARLRADLVAGHYPVRDITPDAVVAWVSELLDAVGHAAFPTVLDAIAAMTDPLVEDVLASYVGVHLDGREQLVADALPQMPVRIADRLIGLLHGLGTEDSTDTVLQLAISPLHTLRMLASGWLGVASTPTRALIVQRISDPAPEVRWSAIQTSLRMRLRPAAATAERRISSREFHHLPADERALLLELLSEIEPLTGERMAIDLLSRHGLMGDRGLDESRIIAARALGAMAGSKAALAALRAASTPLWWNPPAVRKAAQAAMAPVQRRLSEPGGRS